MKMANVCARCRRDFSSLTAFDRHQDVDYKRRPAVECREPEAAGLVQRADGRWSLPATAASRARASAFNALRAQGR